MACGGAQVTLESCVNRMMNASLADRIDPLREMLLYPQRDGHSSTTMVCITAMVFITALVHHHDVYNSEVRGSRVEDSRFKNKLCRNIRRFRGGLAFKARGFLNYSTLGLSNKEEAVCITARVGFRGLRVEG